MVIPTRAHAFSAMPNVLTALGLISINVFPVLLGYSYKNLQALVLLPALPATLETLQPSYVNRATRIARHVQAVPSKPNVPPASLENIFTTTSV